MVHWKIINKIQEDVLREYPNLTPEENLIVALKVYAEYERIVLTSDKPSSSHGITSYSYPGPWTFKTE